MTAVEHYKALPCQVRSLIEDYMELWKYANDCLDTMISVCPSKESSIRALAEAYAEWMHSYLKAKEKLEGMGIGDDEAIYLGLGYSELHK